MSLTQTELRLAHAWFRDRGVPLVIPALERLTTLIPRSIPVTSWLIVSMLGYALTWTFLLYAASDESGNIGEGLGMSEDQFFLLILGITLLIPVLFLLVPWILRRLLKRVSLRVQYPVGLALLALTALVFSPALTELSSVFTSFFFTSWWATLIFMLVLCVALFLEIDTLLIWAARQSILELWTLTPMIAKVLPVLMVAVLFIFVNGDVWKVANNLSLTRTTEVFDVLFLLAFFVASTTASERTRRLLGTKRDDRLEDFRLEEYQKAAEGAGSPWPALLGRTPAPRLTKPRQISWAEWVNFLAIPVMSQLIQALIFALVVFFFFLWFGSFAIPEATVVNWLGSKPENLSIAGLTIPISSVLVKVSVLLAGFASLNFVASTASDERYFKEFLEPSIAYLREVAIIRNLYLEAHDKG